MPPLPPNCEGTGPAGYRLDCPDCGFEARLSDDLSRAFDVAERHRRRHETDTAEHSVDIRRLDRE